MDGTTLTGNGRIQLVKKAQAVLEKQGHKLKAGTSLMWYETEDGELLLRVNER